MKKKLVKFVEFFILKVVLRVFRYLVKKEFFRRLFVFSTYSLILNFLLVLDLDFVNILYLCCRILGLVLILFSSRQTIVKTYKRIQVQLSRLLWLPYLWHLWILIVKFIEILPNTFVMRFGFSIFYTIFLFYLSIFSGVTGLSFFLIRIILLIVMHFVFLIDPWELKKKNEEIFLINIYQVVFEKIGIVTFWQGKHFTILPPLLVTFNSWWLTFIVPFSWKKQRNTKWSRWH